ncbi:WecB/TagA/CpsF family glycosyltransferase [Granulicella sp. dw_53]|uniref:WecB/TagA/CpsF family glycosyltransferase n=1 Tax=Granulicella sp. dw_53 TaxID=2719792 RepID=UPI001BD379D9|nr:WecB/TagA/CpsF family glycosyltransferase [Granulicella sp. dw_53]
MPHILGLNIATTNYEVLVAQSLIWAQRRESRAVLFANVHMVMEAYDNPGFRAALNRADLNCPDGMPLVWALRSMGIQEASRVYGPDSTLALLDAAEREGVRVGFYGGRTEVLGLLIAEVQKRHPRLQIAYAASPPFRALTSDEKEIVRSELVGSGVQFLFVGLGCPKQERWVMEHVGTVPMVMFGVGAAFDFVAGTTPQAPRWMMRSGLEWAFRLRCEPKRLMVRYLKHNPRYILYFIWQRFRHAD